MKSFKQAPALWVFPSFLSFFAAFTTLSKIFLLTMLTQQRAIDWSYVLFSLPRILGIALAVGGLAWVTAPLLQRPLFALAFGALTGLLGGVAFVIAAA